MELGGLLGDLHSSLLRIVRVAPTPDLSDLVSKEILGIKSVGVGELEESSDTQLEV